MVAIKRIIRNLLQKAFWMLSVLALAASAGIFFYALATYYSTRVSIFYSNSSSTEYISGFAWICASSAAFAFYIFGISAYVIPVFLGYSALVIYKKYKLKDEKIRLCMFIILLMVLSLWGALGSGFHLHDQIIFGGLLGNFLRFFVAGFDLFAIKIVLFFVMCLAFVLITRLIFIKYMLRAFAVSFAYAQRNKIFSKIYVFFVAGLRFCVRVINWCFLLPKYYIQPAIKRECEPEDFLSDFSNNINNINSIDSIDNIVNDITNDAFWHTYKNHAEPENSFVASEPPVTLTQKKYYIPVHDIFAANAINTINTINIDEKNNSEKQNLDIARDARILEEKLAHFGVHGKVRTVKSGPVVTCFEYEPAVDTKLSKITALSDDLLLALQAFSLRIIAPIPGTNVVGFEVARTQRQTVPFAHVIQSRDLCENYNLPLLLGVDVVGQPIAVDLVRLPHVLMAGSTGSGKSVALHSMILSLLINKSPEQLKLILIDPKRLELRAYENIGHLLFPVITEVPQTLQALNWVVQTMHERYERMAQSDVRNIAQYNLLCKQNACEPMPYIVIVIDELADLMLAAGNQLEVLIVRIAQMARAAGIHLIVATQRPSVDVITGLIKVNFVSRIALRVTSAIDSRVILDEDGAQRLVGAGDMLMRDSNGILKRIHGAYCTNEEIAQVVSYIKKQYTPEKIDFINLKLHAQSVQSNQSDQAEPLYSQVLEFLQEIDEVSISLLQRRFRIGFNRSARIIDSLEAEGKIINASGGKTRKVVRSQ